MQWNCAEGGGNSTGSRRAPRPGTAPAAGRGPGEVAGPMLVSAPMRLPRNGILFGLVLVATAGTAGPGAATPYDFVSVQDAIESEIRVLDVLGPRAGLAPLPHLGSRPLQVVQLLRAWDPSGPGGPAPGGPAAAIARARVERALGRDAAGWTTTPAGATPRALALASGEDERFELSAGFEGAGVVAQDRAPRLVSGSGAHLRIAAGLDRWLVYSHLVVGRFDGARRFADPIVKGTDATTLTEETFFAYTGSEGRWGLQFGRGRFHWGPGDEGSLLLSRTAAPVTAFAMRGSFTAWRLHAVAMSATLDAAAGEQFAAHRLEWEAVPGLRIGVSEAARYRSDAWQPMYLAGAIPYVLAQRLQVQDEPDSSGALRNNVIASLDAAWRIVPGTRAWGELLLDDLNASGAGNPDKIGWQLGLEGAGTIRGARVTWGTEVTRLSRFVYTSFFGRSFEAQGAPLGFPSGPDSRRLRARFGWDPCAAWQVSAVASLTDRGESGLAVPFVPGTPRPDPWEFAGVVERTRDVELGVRWWPSAGVDVAAGGGWRRVEDAGHVAGADRDEAFGSIALRLVR